MPSLSHIADAIWSAEQAAAASADFSELHAAHGGLLWVAFDPQQARCGLFFWRDGQTRELTPPDFSVRSRVYEYGGGACCATERGVAFVNETDQRIYHLPTLRPAARPEALTADDGRRYGDLSFVAAWQALLAVEESHLPDGVVHRVVRIGLDGSRAVLVEGADFYGSPRACREARQLAWIEWDRPSQPWLATRLCLRYGQGTTQVIAGQEQDQALQQVQFDESGRLWVVSDRDGAWQPCRWVDGTLQAQTTRARDHASAPWQLGGCSYLPLPGGGLLASHFEAGFGVLTERTGEGRERRLAQAFSRFRGLAADADHYYCIAASPQHLPALLAISRMDGALQVIAGAAQPLDKHHLPRPEPFSCAVSEERCHGFFYPAFGQKRPPLLIFLHGGPTSASYPVFDPRIAFWTLRGYAVLDLNYRGSSGYGRAYRLRLAERWGELEVEDIRASIQALTGQGVIDPDQVFVRGASAGGYSALRALVELPQLRGGASLYGVSDPLALRRQTHKFEADYLDWLIGDPSRHPERYRQRTPLLQAECIRAPVIFFQGELDAVVVPAQTESMVAALRKQGLAVQSHVFAGERHGFRQAANLAKALRLEWAFYQGLLAP